MSIPDTNNNKIRSANLFPVVGIGASAGGLEAFKQFIKAIPEQSGIAYIFVQHLHPEHISSLPDILQRETKIPVCEITNNEEVRPDHIYIIPANKILVATDGVLQLSARPSDHLNMPIDVFFSSLAEVHQSHAIGIVLSGTGSDGTLGLKKIKDQGGITFAQDPGSASYVAMPQSAINAAVADFILPPAEMPQRLQQVNRTFQRSLPDPDAKENDPKDKDSVKQVLYLLRVRKGVDFTFYKQTTIHRRILRRMALLKLENIDNYLVYLKQNYPEQENLFQDLLIPVTSFFRDPNTYEYLCDAVFPKLTKNRSADNPLRIWIAGCSTGEEVYSIGMCLHECLGDKLSALKIQIFATDISEQSIAKARAGIYNKRELDGVSDVRLQQFFAKTNGNYQVKKIIRDMCVFANHNFLKDPPFSRIDLVCCRNVLIYMEPYLQKKALATFHYALNEKGFLLLGRSETTGSSPDLFLSYGKKEKLYSKKSIPGRFMHVTSEQSEGRLIDKDYSMRGGEKRKDDYQKSADEILLSTYTPPGIIVNEQHDIVQFRGSIGDFLEPAPGKASLNVLKMVRQGLSFDLRNALHKAKITQEPFTKEGIAINQGKRLVTIAVIPLTNTIEPYFLILFKDIANHSRGGNLPASESHKQDDKDRRIEQLEKDLLQGRESMSRISEDQEAANEELQSANEELLSGSEELQTLNEELETSKEELQSTNEELISLNQELHDRNVQLDQARSYAEAIVSTIHEPLLVLDHDFKIISFNRSFLKTFLITEEDTIGKIIFDLQHNQWNIPGLRGQLMKIQTGNERSVEWEATYAFPFAGKRVISFNAQPVQKENGKNWILLAFSDVTLWREREMIEQKYSADLRQILETIPQITLTAAPDGSITYFNQYFLEYSGMTLAEALEEGWESLMKPEMAEHVRAKWEHSITTGEDLNMEVQLKRKKDNMYRWHLVRATAIRNTEGVISSWVGAAIDFHGQKIRDLEKDEFMSIASHELKTPLTTAKAYVQLLEQNLVNTDDTNLQYAKRAASSLERLNDLISELLDASKIQNGKLNLNIAAFDFNEMLSSAVEEVQFVSPLHTILRTGEISRPVTGDRQRLKQVVVNLLTNAVKYSPGSDKVFIHANLEDRKIMVSVKDTGIGIRKENLEKIFELYYRVEGRPNNFHGLGIGLTIAHEIVERHKGEIWVESEPGKGSSFFFTLPTDLLL